MTQPASINELPKNRARKGQVLLRLIILVLLSFGFWSSNALAAAHETIAQNSPLHQPHQASQAEQAQQTQNKKVYLVGVEDVSYYPLFDFDSQSVTKPSFARDLLSAFFESHQLAFKFVALPIKRFDKWYLEHDIDFKFPDNFRWRNDQSNRLGITFSDPVVQLEAGTYVTKQAENITRREVSSIATIRGFHPSLWLQELAKKRVTLVEESTPLAIVRHVLAGNASATNIDSNVINAALKKLNREGEIVLAEGIFHQQYAYHFSSIQHPDLIFKFNEFLQDNAELLAKLKQKYKIVEKT